MMKKNTAFQKRNIGNLQNCQPGEVPKYMYCPWFATMIFITEIKLMWKIWKLMLKTNNQMRRKLFEVLFLVIPELYLATTLDHSSPPLAIMLATRMRCQANSDSGLTKLYSSLLKTLFVVWSMTMLLLM